jgi:hypothetical protein
MKFPAPDDINPSPAKQKSNTKALFLTGLEGGLTLKPKRASLPEVRGKCKRLLKYSANPYVRNVYKS